MPDMTFAGINTVALVDHFLDHSLCRMILDDLEFAFWKPSEITEANDRHVINASRRSESTDEFWFGPKLQLLIVNLDRRIGALIPGFTAKREPWQATRYNVGDEFQYHHDCSPLTRNDGGNREYTVLVFLETPKQGGCLHFKVLSKTVAPKFGRLLVWRNLDESGECDYRMMHASMPVRSGRKTILVTWAREQPWGRSSWRSKAR